MVSESMEGFRVLSAPDRVERLDAVSTNAST
jgi:hypothetical protein